MIVVGFLENAKAFCENALGSPKMPFGGHVTVLPLFIAIVMAIIILGIVGIVGCGRWTLFMGNETIIRLKFGFYTFFPSIGT